MEKRIAIYAGSFDPITRGHMWMIEQGSLLFDKLYVVVAYNADKKNKMMFAIEDRFCMVKKCCEDIVDFSNEDLGNNIEVRISENILTADFAKQLNAQYILRGIRNVSDFEYEKTTRHINRDIQMFIETVYLIPPREISEVSSSMVKGMMDYEGWERIVGKYAPSHVVKELVERKKRQCLTKS